MVSRHVVVRIDVEPEFRTLRHIESVHRHAAGASASAGSWVSTRVPSSASMKIETTVFAEIDGEVAEVVDPAG